MVERRAMSVVQMVLLVQRFPVEGFALSEKVIVVDVVNGLSWGGSVASTARRSKSPRVARPIEVGSR